LQVKGAIALVTGAARGLGFAIATRLHAMGAVVVVADRDRSALDAVPDHFERVCFDVTQPDEVRSEVGRLTGKHGKLEILVNNAGVIFSEPFVNVMNPAGIMHDYGRFRDSLTLNLDSVFIVTSAVVEQMVQRRTKGVVVNISSISACGNEGQTAYSAAKAAVNAMTVTWSKELGRWGIRCNAVAPGFIGTESTRRALNDSIVKHIESSTPLRRLGAAEEVAHAVSALIENDFINGAILNVNGGLTI
jgi:3-oxoacyl-[acyl-carrier protein] reductase